MPPRASSGAGAACWAPAWPNLGGSFFWQLRPACSRAGQPPRTPYACPARRFGVVFGANRQNQDVSKANVGEFGGDIADAAKKAFAGQPVSPAAQ